MQLNTLDDTAQEFLQQVLALVRNVLEIASERLQRSPDVGLGDGGELPFAFRLDLELRGMLSQLLSLSYGANRPPIGGPSSRTRCCPLA